MKQHSQEATLNQTGIALQELQVVDPFMLTNDREQFDKRRRELSRNSLQGEEKLNKK